MLIYSIMSGRKTKQNRKKRKIEERDLKGFKYFKAISSVLESLHEAACKRDQANNRKLHMDQYVSLFLLYMFNPICSSLRAIQQASELQKVQRKLGCPRASLGSLSESARVFDSKLIEPIIERLAHNIGPIYHDKRLEVGQIVTLVDGSSIQALQKLTCAAWDTEKTGIKAHTRFDLEKYVPVHIEVTENNSDERKQLLEDLHARHRFRRQ